PDGFVYLLIDEGNAEEDLELVRRLIRYCTDMALNVPPAPMKDIVDAIDNAFRVIDVRHRSFTPKERNYLQLHLLVSLHNLSFDIGGKIFKAMTGQQLPNAQPMLTVTAEDPTL